MTASKVLGGKVQNYICVVSLNTFSDNSVFHMKSTQMSVLLNNNKVVFNAHSTFIHKRMKSIADVVRFALYLSVELISFITIAHNDYTTSSKIGGTLIQK